MKKISKFIFFTTYGMSLSIAKRLKDEGNTVIYAVISDKKTLKLPNDKPEKPEDKEYRLALGNGIIDKVDAGELLKKMKGMTNKDEWFVFFDFNNMYTYAEAVMKMGFKNGFFPTKEQFELEEDRDKGKDFVKKYYKDIRVAEVHDYKKIDEAIKVLETTDKVWVLKGYSADASTVVPASDDVEKARQEIIGALKLEQKDYEKDGFILEEMIRNMIEITPEVVFYNGEPVMYTVDIENKPIGAGSTGNMTGCASNLVVRTEPGDGINKIAFPEIVMEMASKHPGLFVWDASILINSKNGKKYFGEFCANRFGYDSLYTEIEMADSATDFFNMIINGENPLVKRFGVAVRMFNLKKHVDVPIIVENDEHVWFYDMQKKDDKFVTVGESWDAYVTTGAGNSLNEATDEAYEEMSKTSFTNGYYRPKFDFLSKDYPNSIINRYDFTKHKFFHVPEAEEDVIFADLKGALEGVLSHHKNKLLETKEKGSKNMSDVETKYQDQIKDMKKNHEKELKSLRDELKDIMESYE